MLWDVGTSAFLTGASAGAIVGLLAGVLAERDHVNRRRMNAEAKSLADLKASAVGFCIREPGHDGPCNGYPLPSCGKKDLLPKLAFHKDAFTLAMKPASKEDIERMVARSDEPTDMEVMRMENAFRRQNPLEAWRNIEEIEGVDYNGLSLKTMHYYHVDGLPDGDLATVANVGDGRWDLSWFRNGMRRSINGGPYRTPERALYAASRIISRRASNLQTPADTSGRQG